MPVPRGERAPEPLDFAGGLVLLPLSRPGPFRITISCSPVEWGLSISVSAGGGGGFFSAGAFPGGGSGVGARECLPLHSKYFLKVEWGWRGRQEGNAGIKIAAKGEKLLQKVKAAWTVVGNKLRVVDEVGGKWRMNLGGGVPK